MAKSKVVSSGTMTPVRGGKGHMFGGQHANARQPGITGKEASGSKGKFGAKGGGTGKIGRQGKGSRVVAGRVSVSK